MLERRPRRELKLYLQVTATCLCIARSQGDAGPTFKGTFIEIFYLMPDQNGVSCVNITIVQVFN